MRNRFCFHQRFRPRLNGEWVKWKRTVLTNRANPPPSSSPKKSNEHTPWTSAQRILTKLKNKIAMKKKKNEERFFWNWLEHFRRTVKCQLLSVHMSWTLHTTMYSAKHFPSIHEMVGQRFSVNSTFFFSINWINFHLLFIIALHATFNGSLWIVRNCKSFFWVKWFLRSIISISILSS